MTQEQDKFCGYFIVSDESNEPVLSYLRGQLVSVIERTGDSLTVECGDGYNYSVFTDELTPSPCRGNPIPDLFFGDKVLAVGSFHEVVVSHHYVVDDIARNGLLRLARFDNVSNEYQQLKGWYDPACFRRD